MASGKIKIGGGEYVPRAVVVRRVTIQSAPTGRPAIVVVIAIARRVPKKSPPLQGEFRVRFTLCSIEYQWALLRVVPGFGWSDATYLLNEDGSAAGISAGGDRVIFFDQRGRYNKIEVIQS